MVASRAYERSGHDDTIAASSHPDLTDEMRPKRSCEAAGANAASNDIPSSLDAAIHGGFGQRCVTPLLWP